MKINAIITGSTGMVGKGVLLECLDSPDVESVLLVNRRPLGISHRKITEIIHGDLGNLSAVRDRLSGYNACFHCMGVSAKGMSESDYRRLTYDATMHISETLLELNPSMTFCYVSGAGTDSDEKSSMMWARVKGKTENDLLAKPFKASYVFRPAYIQPMRGVTSSTSWYNVVYAVAKPLYPILNLLAKRYVTTTIIVGKAMIEVAKNGADRLILESNDIRRYGTMASDKNI